MSLFRNLCTINSKDRTLKRKRFFRYILLEALAPNQTFSLEQETNLGQHFHLCPKLRRQPMRVSVLPAALDSHHSSIPKFAFIHHTKSSLADFIRRRPIRSCVVHLCHCENLRSRFVRLRLGRISKRILISISAAAQRSSLRGRCRALVEDFLELLLALEVFEFVLLRLRSKA